LADGVCNDSKGGRCCGQKNNWIYNNGDDLSGCSATYSCIEDGDAGTGNISSDPHFVDEPNDNFHITVYSPCIDTGDPCGSYTGEVDIDSEPRVQGGIVDMGADESFEDTFRILDSFGHSTVIFDNSGDVFLKGTLDVNTTRSATDNNEFRFQDSDGNDIAIIDGDSGNMYIYGQIFEEQAVLTPSGDNHFIIEDSDGNTVAYIDDPNGDLYLKGLLYEQIW